MDDNFKHRLKNWVDKREAQNRMRMKDITHVVDPGRIIPKEDTEVEDHNYYGQKIREYVLKRLNELVVNKSEELNKGKIINPPEIPKVTPETEEYFSGVSYEGSYPKLEEATKKGKTFYFPLTNKNLKNVNFVALHIHSYVKLSAQSILRIPKLFYSCRVALT